MEDKKGPSAPSLAKRNTTNSIRLLFDAPIYFVRIVVPDPAHSRCYQRGSAMAIVDGWICYSDQAGFAL